MKRLGKLIDMAMEAERLKGLDLYRNNPFMSKTYRQLRSMMLPDAVPGVPENGTREKDLYNVALLEAARTREKRALFSAAITETADKQEPDNNATANNPDPLEAWNRLYGGWKA